MLVPARLAFPMMAAQRGYLEYGCHNTIITIMCHYNLLLGFICNISYIHNLTIEVIQSVMQCVRLTLPVIRCKDEKETWQLRDLWQCIMYCMARLILQNLDKGNVSVIKHKDAKET